MKGFDFKDLVKIEEFLNKMNIDIMSINSDGDFVESDITLKLRKQE